jgi:thioesterase domain-containing protein
VQPPRDDLEKHLVALWEEILDVRPVGITDNFFDLGGHSLLAIRLFARIEADHGRSLPLSALFSGGTIEDLAGLLRDRSETSAQSPLVTLRHAGTRPPFFCVHPAGGIVYCFHDLARQVAADRPVHAFQAPGLDGEREPFGSIEDLARLYVDALVDTHPTGSIHLGGWSLGGIVAFEMAALLRQRGRAVATLAVFDTDAPSGRQRNPAENGRGGDRSAESPRYRSNLDEFGDEILEFAHEFAAELGGDARQLDRHLRSVAPERRLEWVLTFFGLDRVYHLETSPERVRRLWSVLRANLLATARYQPTPQPERILLFRALRTPRRRSTDRTLGWSELARSGVAVHEISGDHASILKPPAVRRLAEILESEMRVAEGEKE